MVQQMQPELKQTPIAAVRAVNNPIPAITSRNRAKIDHPQVGQTVRQHQARQPHGIAEMTLLDAEAAALLVRKEGFDLTTLPIPMNRTLGIAQITDQIQRRLLQAVPY